MGRRPNFSAKGINMTHPTVNVAELVAYALFRSVKETPVSMLMGTQTTVAQVKTAKTKIQYKQRRVM
jgi:hypothetical protein